VPVGITRYTPRCLPAEQVGITHQREANSMQREIPAERRHSLWGPDLTTMQ
jgi:hypothetical protein